MRVLGLLLFAAGAFVVVWWGVLDPIDVGERDCTHNRGPTVECSQTDRTLFIAGAFAVGVPIALVGVLVLVAAFRPEGATVSLRPWRR